MTRTVFHLDPLRAAMFDGNQEACAAVGKVEKKGVIVQCLDLATGIDGVGSLNSRYAQAHGLETHLANVDTVAS